MILIIPSIIASIIIFFLIVAVCVFTLYANENFHTNFEVARVTLRATISKTVNVTTDIRDKFIELETLRNQTDFRLVTVKQQLDDLVNAQVTLKNATSGLIRDIGRANKIRYVGLCIILALCLLVPILSAFSGLTCCKGFSLFGFKIGTYCLVLVWVGFAIHFPAAILTSDFCISVDNYVVQWNQTQGGTSTNTTSNSAFQAIKGVLDVILTCQQNGAILNFEALFDEASSQLLAGINYVVTSSDPASRNWNYRLNNYTASVNQPFIQSNTTAQAMLNPLVDMTNRYVALDDKFEQLVDCTFIANAFKTVRDSSCLGGLASMDIMWSAFLILGVIMIPTTWIALTGYKWYRKRKFDKPQPKSKGGVEVEMVMLNGRQVPLEHAEVS